MGDCVWHANRLGRWFTVSTRAGLNPLSAGSAIGSETGRVSELGDLLVRNVSRFHETVPTPPTCKSWHSWHCWHAFLSHTPLRKRHTNARHESIARPMIRPSRRVNA